MTQTLVAIFEVLLQIIFCMFAFTAISWVMLTLVEEYRKFCGCAGDDDNVEDGGGGGGQGQPGDPQSQQQTNNRTTTNGEHQLVSTTIDEIQLADIWDLGPVAQRAGLFGLTIDERMKTLKYLFSRTTYFYGPNGELIPIIDDEAASNNNNNNDDENNSNNANNNSDRKSSKKDRKSSSKKKRNGDSNSSGNLEGGMLSENPEISVKSDRVDLEEGKTSSSDKHDNNEQKQQKHDDDDEYDLQRGCCICIAEYEVGQQVLFSTTCLHHFHAECAYEWLRKNDHCPYCRQEMFTAEDMRVAALNTLGAERFGMYMAANSITNTIIQNAIERNIAANNNNSNNNNNDNNNNGRSNEENV